LQYVYSVSVCEPLPPSPAPADEDCAVGTYVCGLVSSVREGHDDNLISVVPVAGGENLNPTAAYVEGESTLAKGWTLSMSGGKYNEVDQSVAVEMVCDASADKDVSSRAAPGSTSQHTRLTRSPSCADQAYV